MLDLVQIRERVSLGTPGDLTHVDLGFLAQVLSEIEEGREASAELARMKAREGMTFGTGRRL